MDSDQDPIEQAADEETDLYAVSTWEARSVLDHVACGIYRHGGWLLAGLGVLIVYYLFAFRNLSTITDPRVALLVGLSVVPTVALAAYVRFANVTTGEPLSVLFVTFLLGILLAGFAIPLNAFSRLVFVRTVPVEFLGLVLFYLLVVGPFEEMIKLLAVRLFAYNHPRFDAVIDGAVYGAVAGLGFATIENALYITEALSTVGPFQQTDSPFAALKMGSGITVSRALAGPGHVLYSAIAGYHLGLAKFNRGNAGPIVIKGLLVAALAHGVYNTGAGVIPDLLGVTLGLSSLTALLIYVVGFNSVVGSYLYAKLKRYRTTYTEVGADEIDPGSSSRTGHRTGGSDSTALAAIDRRTAGGVGPYPGTEETQIFEHRVATSPPDGTRRNEHSPALARQTDPHSSVSSGEPADSTDRTRSEGEREIGTNDSTRLDRSMPTDEWSFDEPPSSTGNHGQEF